MKKQDVALMFFTLLAMSALGAAAYRATNDVGVGLLVVFGVFGLCALIGVVSPRPSKEEA